MISRSEARKQADRQSLLNMLGESGEFVSDILNRGIATQNKPSRAESTVALGFILETCPTLHAYMVAVTGGRGPILCCALQTGGGNPTLSFDSSMYSVGCQVLVALHDNFGIILGAVPLEGTGNDLTLATRTSGSSRNYPEASDKTCVDQATEENPEVGIRHFGHGLPADTTDIGEFGHTTLTGVRTMLNPFMALTAVDDYSGLWMFNMDSLVRLSGLNLQIRSAGRENEYLNDNGEYIEYKGSVTYPWEQVGYTQEPTGSTLLDETKTDDWKKPETWKSFVEPSEDKVKPFHRVAEYSGWLGQGKYTQIVAPDPDNEWTKFGQKEKLYGLLRESKTIDGWHSSSASSGVFIGKRGVLPAVTRVQRPDDTSEKIGDNPKNYSKTNQFSAKAEIPGRGQPMEKVLGLADSIAYQQNFKELLPFLQHKEDYYIPEDSVLNEGYSRFADLSQLKSQNTISVKEGPKVALLQGSSTYREVKVNPAEAGIACTSDGSQVLYGGCGEEIRMAGGSVSIDAPGDIWFRSGRKIILWAGDDIEIRAKGHIDVSTTDGSVRIKAEGKLSMLGGNNKKDGVLIESKGTSKTYDFKGGEEDQFGGILLKSASNVGVLGETIYLRSGVNGGGDGIFFDANNGNQSIITMCNSNINFVEDSFDINYSNLKTGDINATTNFTENTANISGDLTVTGNATVVGNIMSGASINAVGHINTGESKNNGGYVGELDKDRVKKDLQDQEDNNSQALSSNATSNYESYITNRLTSENSIANESTLTGAGFSFRKSYEYNLPEDFAVYESRWQNIAKNTGQSNMVWKEKAVQGDFKEDTYPFPGRDAYTGTPCYVTQAWTLTDYETGLYKDRWNEDGATNEYKNPQFGEQQKKVLNEYPIL